MNRTIVSLGLAVMLLLLSDRLFAEQKSEPFSDIDQTWQNGSDRRDSSVFKNMKYFTPHSNWISQFAYGEDMISWSLS